MIEHDTIQIVTWFLLVASGLAVVARLVTKWMVSKRFSTDDCLAIIALVSSLGSGLTISVGSGNCGLGNEDLTLSSHNLRVTQQKLYAANLLYVATLCFSKLSCIYLLCMIFRSKMDRCICISLASIIGVWSLSSILVLAFQSSPPNVWDLRDASIDLAAFWRYYLAVNILTDLSLVFLPMYFIRAVQMSQKRKNMILMCFATRLFDIVASGAQIAYTDGFNMKHDIPPRQNYIEPLAPFYLIGQVVQAVTLITNCIPYLRQLLETLPSRMYMSDEIRRKGLTFTDTTYGYENYDLGPGPNGARQLYLLRDDNSETGQDRKANFERRKASIAAVTVGQNSRGMESALGENARGRPSKDPYTGCSREPGMLSASQGSGAFCGRRRGRSADGTVGFEDPFEPPAPESSSSPDSPSHPDIIEKQKKDKERDKEKTPEKKAPERSNHERNASSIFRIGSRRKQRSNVPSTRVEDSDASNRTSMNIHVTTTVWTTFEGENEQGVANHVEQSPSLQRSFEKEEDEMNELPTKESERA